MASPEDVLQGPEAELLAISADGQVQLSSWRLSYFALQCTGGHDLPL